AWAEGQSRDWSRTWWGLQEYEVKEWVIPCLSQTDNYWVKYQYLATIYSKERDIWPQPFYWPERFVHQRPWRMECNTARTQCTIGLARRPCQELTGWTELCQSHYDNEYNTYAHEVVWKKIGGVWRKSLGGGSTCAETVLGHNFRHRKSIMDVIVPFIPDSVIALAELYAFRQHLCSGSIDKGLDWVGYNLFYSNLTCKPPKETWKNCGEGAYHHACSWYETLGHSVSNVVFTVAQEAGHIIGEGVSVVEGWIANLFMMLWPYLLAAVGVIVVVIICKVLVQQFLRSMLSPGRRSYQPLPLRMGPPLV
ncbi:hypothetical protein XENOCAPTIV_014272, partial [Xenoophorus captivus]